MQFPRLLGARERAASAPSSPSKPSPVIRAPFTCPAGPISCPLGAVRYRAAKCDRTSIQKGSGRMDWGASPREGGPPRQAGRCEIRILSPLSRYKPLGTACALGRQIAADGRATRFVRAYRRPYFPNGPGLTHRTSAASLGSGPGSIVAGASAMPAHGSPGRLEVHRARRRVQISRHHTAGRLGAHVAGTHAQ
jgi:hypothetical protein